MANLQGNTDDINDLFTEVKKIKTDIVDEKIRDFNNNIVTLDNDLNDLTQKKIGKIDFAPVKSSLESIAANLEEAISILDNQIKGFYNTDGKGNSGNGNPDISGFNSSNNSSNSSGGSSDVTNNSVSDIVANGNNIVPSLTIASAVGTVVFREILTLYETIGAPSGIPSNVNGNYLVLGIIKSGDKNYCKIVDKDTSKIYYVEVSEKIEFKTELENVLNVKDKTMILSSTEIGTNNFVKLADQNTMYIVINETENGDITFCNILDPVDGNAYYIPISDEVEKISINSLFNTSNNDNNSEVSG